MTSTLEDDSDGHGPNFMAAYITLLARYLRLDAAGLRRHAAKAGIDVASWPEAQALLPPAVVAAGARNR